MSSTEPMDTTGDEGEATVTSSSTTAAQHLPLSLHDCLSLGEVEAGLAASAEVNGSIQEIQRLPAFLRLLSVVRPLSNRSQWPWKEDEGESTSLDPLVDQTVQRLEHVAASHACAEALDVLTCHLTPSITKKISKLPALQKVSTAEKTTWDTAELIAVARSPLGPRLSRKRRRFSDAPMASAKAGEDDSDAELLGSDEESSDEDKTKETAESSTNPTSKKRPRMDTEYRRDSMDVAAEDSQEASVVKTLSELATLVATSLIPVPSPTGVTEGEEADHGPNHHAVASQKGVFALVMDDSSLVESGEDGTDMRGSDLGSTVAAIMHHAPVLRSRHVAKALCRASIPLIGRVMTLLGANCPASVAALLLGCVESYQQALEHQNSSILNTAKEGVRALAKLSTREQSRVLQKLQELGLMKDVQLELALQQSDPQRHLALSLLQRELSIMEDWELSKSKGDGNLARVKRNASDDSEQWSEPTLRHHMYAQPGLFQLTLACFAEIFDLVSRSSRICQGQLALTLKAYCWLLLVPCKTKEDFFRPKYLLEKNLTPLQGLVDKVIELASDSTFDVLFEVLQTTVLLTCARILEDDSIGDPGRQRCQELMKIVSESPRISKRIQAFRYLIESFIEKDEVVKLGVTLLWTLETQDNFSIDQLKPFLSDIQNGLAKLCSQSTKQPKGSDCTFLSVEAILDSALLELEEKGLDADGDVIKGALEKTLRDEASNGSSRFGHNAGAEFVSKATKMLCESKALSVPLVMTVSLEQNFADLAYPPQSSTIKPRLLLQTLHAFEYLDLRPESPFAIDPRSLPMKELLSLCQGMSDSKGKSFLHERLYELVGKHCPDIYVQLERSKMRGISKESTPFQSSGRQETMKSLFSSLRLWIESEKEELPDIEFVYHHAAKTLSDEDLHTTVCSAFLATSHRPKPAFTYHLLCGDPLVLFKCPIRIWKSPELRRIALTTLSTLMDANTVMVFQSTPTEGCVEEYLASRDTVAVRCLLMCVSGIESTIGPFSCSMTASFIRTLVSGHRGIVTCLIKQGLPEVALDWLVENVPESMNDSETMLRLFSDQSSLTPAERLQAADAMLRIAIVHGGSDETSSANMTYVALLQLIDSFFLVIGPVGVPVNALISDDSGQDVTQIARKAAFRIVKALSRVRGRRKKMQKECGLALQKLANLCKSESSVGGVAGAVAGRRKGLLKELYDHIVKASNSMGAPLGSQPGS